MAAEAVAADRWPGRALHSSLPYGRSECELVIRSHALVARLPDGRELSVPFSGLRFRRQGERFRELVFENTTPGGPTLTSTEEPVLVALSALGVPEVQAALQQQRLQVRRQLVRRFVVPAVLLLLIFGGGSLLLLGPGVGLALKAIPTSTDESLGTMALESSAAELSQSDDAAPDPAAVQRAERLLQRLMRAGSPSPFKFQLRVYRSEVLNAFALPGGIVILTTELLEKTENDDEVAGVLAHEMAHVNLRHGMRQILQRVGIWALAAALVGDVSAVVAVAVRSAQELAGLGFSRDMEREADEAAVVRARAAGFDPRGLARFLTRAAATRAAGGSEQTLRFLSTHPVTEDRVARIEQLAAR